MFSGVGGGIEFAVSGAVDKALPLVPVEHQDPPRRVARHPHEDPVAARPAIAQREGDLDRAIAIPRPLPGKTGEVDAELVRGRLVLGHGTLATAQYSQRDPSLSASATSSAPQSPL